jgi:hypothetical protein
MSNYIFVDFDGPLLPGKSHIFDYNRKTVMAFMRGEDAIPSFDPIAVQMHNLWARYGDAKVVFSTSWGRHVRPYERTESYLKQVMRENGYTGDFAEHCITPKRRSSEHIHEIQEWLCDYLKPEDKFIAVDDANLSYLSEGSWKDQGRWIQVNYNNGLSWENFEDGCAALGVDTEHMAHLEYGIVPLTQAEKDERKQQYSWLASSI